uniref:EF-hand domain-containing protein n=2 Tax=Haptolina ericina TaxID=156174 RepID=A0A7S3ARI8_9EUKA
MKVRLNMNQFDEQFSKADKDQDNAVSYDEFVEWYNGFAEFARMLERQSAAKSASACNTPRSVCNTPRGSLSAPSTPRVIYDGRAKTVEVDPSEQALIFELMAYDASPAAAKRLQMERLARGGDGDQAKYAAQSLMLTKELMVKCPVLSFTDSEKMKLREIFMLAVSGSRFGSASTGRTLHGSQLAKSEKKKGAMESAKEDMLDLNVDTARMDLEEFASFTKGVFALEGKQEKWFGPMLHTSLVRNSDDKDGKFTFEQLVRLMGPLGKGCPAQRAAFMFAAYDSDGSGLITQKEVFDMCKMAPPGGPFELDLLALVRSGKPHHTLEDYIAHVTEEGECGVVDRAHRILGIDSSRLPTDDQILKRLSKTGVEQVATAHERAASARQEK